MARRHSALPLFHRERPGIATERERVEQAGMQRLPAECEPGERTTIRPDLIENMSRPVT